MAFDKKAYSKAYNADMREDLKRNGLCVASCKLEARPDRTLCQACADKLALCPARQSTEGNRKKWRDRRRAPLAKGLCVDCRNRLGKDGTKWRCCRCASAHRKAERARYAARTQAAAASGEPP